MGQFCMGGVQREISVSCLKVGLRHVEATRVAETGQEEEAQVGQWTHEEPLERSRSVQSLRCLDVRSLHTLWSLGRFEGHFLTLLK